MNYSLTLHCIAIVFLCHEKVPCRISLVFAICQTRKSVVQILHAKSNYHYLLQSDSKLLCHSHILFFASNELNLNSGKYYFCRLLVAPQNSELALALRSSIKTGAIFPSSLLFSLLEHFDYRELR